MAQVELDSKYNPRGLEKKWYKAWEDQGYFSFKRQLEQNRVSLKDVKPADTFSMVIPPPNVTGSLHLGHALNHSVQDILARYNRMRGKYTLWVPGTDHAGIATQNVVEKRLADEGKSRQDFSREDFEKKVWKWKAESGGIITHQQRQLGESVDWSFERFTMDEGLSKIVKNVFVKLYEEGLIYRAERMINWCPVNKTAISNIEVEYKKINGNLYHIKYPIKHSDQFIQIATTRPETMLGDEAIAVHPDDERYKDLVGKTVILPLMNREILIIADDYVDQEFGTGAVKITPAHDPNDFEIGKRHNLPLTVIMTPEAKINERGGKYAGSSREAARKQVVADLEAEGLLVDIEKHPHQVGHNSRSGAVVEPMPSTQWFVNIKPLAEKAINVVKSGSIEFIPKRWQNTYFDWMHNIQDWCISRQLWWGHRIPAWYDDQGEVYVGFSEEDVRKKNNLDSSVKLKQDDDVLDTWFSSALWPFSTLMNDEIEEGRWPEDSDELKAFYPTSVLVTGFDIIFFWVARMIMMGVHFKKEIPFEKIYIHGLVRDADRQKMSKSKGNVVNPLEKMNDYGTDAFRFFLISILPEGKDIIYDESRLKGYSAFCNKIWNTARFILMNQDESFELEELNTKKLSNIDHWILTEYNSALTKVEDSIKNYRFAEYANEIYDFFWRSFCDNYIELSKVSLQQGSKTTRQILNHVFLNALKLLHPIMPFITEELFSIFHKSGNLIIAESWPEPIEADGTKHADVEALLHVVYKIRYLRGEFKLSAKEKFKVSLNIEGSNAEVVQNGLSFIEVLTKTEIEFNAFDKCISAVLNFGKAVLEAPEGFDSRSEIDRLSKEKTKLDQSLVGLQRRLENENFVKNANPEVVAAEKVKLQNWTQKSIHIGELIASLS